MDQSGPRHLALKSPLIERADLQSPQQRIGYGVLTSMFWALWLYLWLPLLALLAWALGLQQAYKYMVVLGGYQEVLRLLMLYALVILLLGGTLVFWAIYNIVRFHGVENRRVNLAITPAEIARDFDMEQAAVERWQSAHTLQVTHDENGRITDAEISKKPAISR